MTAGKLQQLLTDSVSIDNLILAKAALTNLAAGYQELGVETPEWVVDKFNQVSRELVERNRAELERRLRSAKARRAGLATAEEKRKGLDDEIAQLEAKLTA